MELSIVALFLGIRKFLLLLLLLIIDLLYSAGAGQEHVIVFQRDKQCMTHSQ